MSNNTSSVYVVNSSELDLLIWKIGGFLFPAIGLPGHMILILIYLTSNQRRSQPTSLYFISISIVESIYLIFLFWDWLDVMNLVSDPRQILNCAFFYPFVTGTGYISLILLVLLNFDRISIIQNPQQTNVNITHKRIFLKIFFTFSTIISIFIYHYYFSLYYDSKSFIIFGQTCRVYQHAYVWFYVLWPYIHLCARLIPCLILIVCTIYIFINRCRTSSFSRQRQQQIYPFVLVILSIYTFLAVIPISILQIFNRSMWKYDIDCFNSNYSTIRIERTKQWKLFNVICIMWETSIYVIKFYIKLFYSSEFRFDIKQKKKLNLNPSNEKREPVM